MKHDSFLKNKLTDVNLKQLLFLEWEGFWYWIFNTIPGTIGFLMRNITTQFLFKKKDGMAWIQPRVTLVETNKIVVGKNWGVNSGTYINGKGGIMIGDNVLIGSNVTISSGKHPIDGIGQPIFQRPTIPMKIVIEDDVWIGGGAVIMPGVVLKKGTVVGANAVVTKDTEEYSVVAGAPARCLRYRYDSKDRIK